jgi:hypothetical protein
MFKPNQINHQNPIDFQALISSTSSTNMAFHLAINQPNPPPPPMPNLPVVINLHPLMVNPPSPLNLIINPVMLPKGLPIIIPQGLMPSIMLANLLKFSRSNYE